MAMTKAQRFAQAARDLIKSRGTANVQGKVRAKVPEPTPVEAKPTVNRRSSRTRAATAWVSRAIWEVRLVN